MNWVLMAMVAVGEVLDGAARNYRNCCVEGKISFSNSIQVFHPKNVVIKEGANMVSGYINAGRNGKIMIEKQASISANVAVIAVQKIYREKHAYLTECGESYKQIIIGAGCLVGANSVIMASVGEGALVGAGSVVTKEVPAFAVAYGNPAKIRGWRCSDD